MDALSDRMKDELQRRMASGAYESVDELLDRALKALDHSKDDAPTEAASSIDAQELLEMEIMKGFKGDDMEMTDAEWNRLEAEAVGMLMTKR